MKNNELLDKFIVDVRKGDPTRAIKQPFAPCYQAAEHNAIIAVLAENKIIGCDGKGRLYLFRSRAGNPLFRIVGGKTMLMGAIFMQFIMQQCASSGLDLYGAMLNGVAAAYFGMHGYFHWRYATLFNRLQTGQLVRLGVLGMMAPISAGACYGFLMNLGLV